MNKSLFISALALAALATTSCSNEETKANEPKSNAIEFGTYIGRDAVSRAKEVTSTTIQSSGFGVTAFYTGQTQWANWVSKTINFMYNQQVTYSASAWSYTPVKYWPKIDGDKISFFAYAPYDAAGTTAGITQPEKGATSGVTSLKFAVQNTAANMVDFVAAQVIDAEQANNAAGGASPVNFAFKHELSRLAFKVKTSMDLKTESHVVIKDIKFVANKTFLTNGTYTFNDKSTTNDVSTRGSWSSTSRANTDYTINDIVNYSALSYGAVEATKKTYAKGFEIASNTNSKDLFKDKDYLFVIPESDNKTEATGLAASTIAVQIKYDIVTEDSNLATGYSCTEATKTVYLPTGILKQGVAYSVTFTINMDEIEVSATVDTWDSETTGNVDVPFTPDVAN